jgi:hypothetical protein
MPRGQTGPDGTTRSQTGPDGTTRSQTGPDETTRSHTGPDGTTRSQTDPGGTTRSQTGPDGTTRSQTGPDGTTRSQEHITRQHWNTGDGGKTSRTYDQELRSKSNLTNHEPNTRSSALFSLPFFLILPLSARRSNYS